MSLKLPNETEVYWVEIIITLKLSTPNWFYIIVVPKSLQPYDPRKQRFLQEAQKMETYGSDVATDTGQEDCVSW